MKTDTKQIIEIIGIFSVVASLIFVGIEIQQSSAVARLEARQARTDQNLEISLTIASDPGLANVMRSLALINSNEMQAQELSAEDSMRLFFVLHSILLNMQTTYDSVQEGILPESNLEQLGAGFLENEVGRANWPVYRTMLDDEFADWFETTMSLN